jgi:Na+-transporting methylmalonyl-CoA/oxaloacetate decarboxylase gamma subunit
MMLLLMFTGMCAQFAFLHILILTISSIIIGYRQSFFGIYSNYSFPWRRET